MTICMCVVASVGTWVGLAIHRAVYAAQLLPECVLLSNRKPDGSPLTNEGVGMAIATSPTLPPMFRKVLPRTVMLWMIAVASSGLGSMSIAPGMLAAHRLL